MQQSSNVNVECYINQLRLKETQDATFEERFNQLVRFKEEYGHCNVNKKYSENPELGLWCSRMRTMYNRVGNGVKSIVLSKDKIERLEQVGFLWRVADAVDAMFQKRCLELIAFRDVFGHCNVPQKYTANQPLGTWCRVLRRSYTKIQKGLINNARVLSRERIVRLEEIGFQFDVGDYDMIFENRCQELIAFKNEFGHCDVPVQYASNRTLGTWCSGMRSSYSRTQRGLPTKSFVPPERFARLDEIGFDWRF